LQPRATFRGFEILSRGKGTLCFGDEHEQTPDLFVRGAATYSAHLNPENPVGTMQSIEHALRSLERQAESEREHIERLEKTLADYQGQAGKHFEHEDRLKALLSRQAQLNAALDLDKGDRQIAEAAEGEEQSADTVVHNGHFSELFINMCITRSDIGGHPCKALACALYLAWKAGELRLNGILLIHMGGPELVELAYFGINFDLFHDGGITGRNRLDLGISERTAFDVLGLPHRGAAFMTCWINRALVSSVCHI
jgi:hypothetical protein